jgi:GDP-L-fucose synthase
MPTNLYGLGDNFDLSGSHVVQAPIRKRHEAKLSAAEVLEIWGTGKPRRGFLHADDLADACIHLILHYDDDASINVGWGEDVSIGVLSRRVASTCGYSGALSFGPSKPDGTPRKLLDV